MVIKNDSSRAVVQAFPTNRTEPAIRELLREASRR
jgi:hypothetical protein